MLFLSHLSFFLSILQGKKTYMGLLLYLKKLNNRLHNQGDIPLLFSSSTAGSGLSHVQGGVHTVMDKKSDFSRWLLSKFCAGEGEVLQMCCFLRCSVDCLSFQASGQAHYLPQWWQCAVQQMARCSVIAPVEGGQTDHIWHTWACSTGICTGKPIDNWDMHDLQISYRNLDKPGWCSFRACAESHTLLDKVIVPRDWSFCAPISWMSPQCFNTWDPDFFFMLQSAPKTSMSDSNFSFRPILSAAI